MKEKIKIIKDKVSYSDFYNWISNGKCFSFARYNDGEWGLILKKEPHYSTMYRKWRDSSPSFEHYGIILKEIISNPIRYYIGISPWVLKEWGSEILNNINDEMVINSHILHDLSKKNLIDFLNLLKTKNTILVGPEYLNELNFFKNHIITREQYVWEDIENIENKIRNIVTDDCIIVYSASIASNIMIDNLFKDYKKITQIDIGSTLDPYCGIASRSGHKKFMEEENIEIKRFITKK